MTEQDTQGAILIAVARLVEQAERIADALELYALTEAPAHAHPNRLMVVTELARKVIGRHDRQYP